MHVNQSSEVSDALWRGTFKANNAFRQTEATENPTVCKLVQKEHL